MTSPVASEDTKISLEAPAISSLASLRILGYIPSGPGDLSTLISVLGETEEGLGEVGE